MAGSPRDVILGHALDWLEGCGVCPPKLGVAKKRVALSKSDIPPPRTDRRRVLTRSALIGAGQRLFAKKSLDGVTIDDIILSADVAKGSFYNHFDGKEGLADTIVKLVQGDCEAEVYAANLDRTDPVERVARDLMAKGVASSLDEVRESDLLLHVVDLAHPAFEDQINVVNKTLAELGVADKRMIMVFNKIDLYAERNFDEYLGDNVKKDIMRDLEESWNKKTGGMAHFISAAERTNIESLKTRVVMEVKQMHSQRYPYETIGWG